MYSIMPSANRVFSSFPIWIPFISFSSVIAVARASKQCCLIVVRVGTLVFSWSQRECFQFFTFENNVCSGFLIYGLYYVEVGSFFAHVLKGIYHKWVLKFFKSFFCLCWDGHMVLSCSLLIWYITLMDIHKYNACILGINPTWSQCAIFLMYFWILFARVLLRIFPSIFINDIGL